MDEDSVSPIIVVDGVADITISVVPIDGSDSEVVAGQLQARWANMSGLRHAILQRSLSNDALVELLAFNDRNVTEATPQMSQSYVAARTLLTPGPDHSAADFTLAIDPSAPKPVLLSIMRCAPGRQQELLDYLTASAARFRGEFGGWTGAALMPVADGVSIVEYLQFESFEAMAKLKYLPIIATHKERIETFGAMDAIAMLPIATWACAHQTAGVQ